MPTDGDPLEALRDTVAALQTPRLPGLPPLTGGMVGYLSLRRRPPAGAAARHRRSTTSTLPELAMLLATDLAVLDHADGSVLLVANAVNYDDTDERVDEAWADAVARLDAMTAELAAPAPSTVAVLERPDVRRRTRQRTEREEYRGRGRAAKEEIRAGEVFQVVVSQRFELRLPGRRPRRLPGAARHQPEPVHVPVCGSTPTAAFDVVGSSPEALVKVSDGRVMMHPIAGHPAARRDAGGGRRSSPRSCSPTPRSAPSTSCWSTSARNDLGRVCEPGTVEVVDFMSVERYSHVMHIVSTVVGRLAPGRTAYDVLAATFPAGTLSGAPKPRAMEIIDELEPTRRGPLRRRGRLPRLRRRPRHGHRDPHRPAARTASPTCRPEPASSPTPTPSRGRGVPQQGGGGRCAPSRPRRRCATAVRRPASRLACALAGAGRRRPRGAGGGAAPG